MNAKEIAKRLMKMQDQITRLLVEIGAEEMDIQPLGTDADLKKILARMVEKRVDIFTLNLLTATDIKGALDNAHIICPDLIQSLGLKPIKRTVTAVQAGIFARSMPQAKRYHAVKGKANIKVWALKGNSREIDMLTKARLYEMYHIEMDRFIEEHSRKRREEMERASGFEKEVQLPSRMPLDPPSFI